MAPASYDVRHFNTHSERLTSAVFDAIVRPRTRRGGSPLETSRARRGALAIVGLIEVRHLRTVVFVSLFASIGAGCAAIAGLGDLEKVDCASDCDGGDDVTSGDDTSTHDVVTSDSLGSHDSSGDTTADSNGDDGSSPDTGSDSTAADAMDADAGMDSNPAADSMTNDEPDVIEAPDVDSGCGPTNTTTNCGACGATCTETHATADTCTGTACTYTCGSNFQDCNAASGHNTDGCECAGTACCSGACQTSHNDGFGDTFYDCFTTFSQNLAIDACRAHVGAAHAAYCQTGFYCTNASDASVGDMVCSSNSPTECDCWGYDDMIQGQTSEGSGAGQSNCLCPQGGATWQ
jgi:hypothetical protein